ncbi:MAG: O-acetylhomoserine aminocarboxypropyltransferase/cysteine synthase [Vampirovibrio sp.]|nr:O-acetylhomoserine aminocarboxypropyltransferase/cysteine synthase [Vampirovibrio sp.]
MTAEKQPSFETLALHAGYTPDATHSRAVPLYQTTSYTFESSQHAADLFALKTFGNIYTRLMNPTTAVFEKRITALEGGVGALATASGKAAIVNAILTLCQTGDEIVASTDLYGGTISLFSHSLKRLGIKVTYVSPNDISAWEQAITPQTKVFFAESVGNPKLEIIDLEPIATLGRKHGIPLVVDNTVPTPYLLKPFEFGAAVVIHSATKFIGGQGTAMGGVVVDGGNFDWEASGRFPDFVNPEPAYHGLKFWETFGKITFIIRARTLVMRDFGAAISPFNAWQFIQGLETLAVRIERHSQSALKVAQWLEAHPAVAWVNYPGLASSKTANLKAKYLPKGQSAVIGFGVKGGAEVAKALVETVTLFSHLANIGDSKSLILHPASTSHSQLTPEQLAGAGVSADYVRLSIGLEDPADLLADLETALAKVSAGALQAV